MNIFETILKISIKKVKSSANERDKILQIRILELKNVKVKK